MSADIQTGLIHSASITAANVHESYEVPNLLHGNQTRFYGDSAYRGKVQRERLKAIAPKAKDFTNKRACRSAPLSYANKETNRRKSSIRAKIEPCLSGLLPKKKSGAILASQVLRESHVRLKKYCCSSIL